MEESFLISYQNKNVLLSRKGFKAWYIIPSGRGRKVKVAPPRVDIASAQKIAQQWLKNNFSKI